MRLNLWFVYSLFVRLSLNPWFVYSLFAIGLLLLALLGVLGVLLSRHPT